MYVKSAKNLAQRTGMSSLAQNPSSSDDSHYQAIIIEIQTQLERKFRDPNDPELYRRRKELRRLFGLVPASHAKMLYDRLESRTDPLGKLFRYKLATATRNEMLGILGKKFSGSPVSSSSPKSKGHISRKRISRNIRTLARKLTRAHRLLTKASKRLKTKAQRELLGDMLFVLSSFSPTGYGVINAKGKVIKSSKRNRLEVINKNRISGQPPFFHYDTRLYLNEQKSTAAGTHRPFKPYYRNSILLYTQHLKNESPSYIAEAIVHEMMHMVLHRFRSIQQKFGNDPARNYPSREAGAMLDVSSFAKHRSAMEQHFLTLVKRLNMQPHRARGFSLNTKTASLWADHLIDEVMAYVFQDRIKIAIARVNARGKNFVVIVFEPVQFMRNYFKKYWVRNPDDRTFIHSEEATKIFDGMEADLKKLVKAVETQIGP